MALIPNKARKAVSEGEVALRNSIFPGAEKLLWEKTRDHGFITIPKTMPFICRILDEMSKNQPLGAVYQMLWTYTWNNNGFVRLGNLSDMAFAVGFGAERGERTLRDRLRRLDELGFIKLKPSGSNPTGFAFIPNPHDIILALHEAREKATPAERASLPDLREETFNAFLQRATDVKAADVKRVQEAQQERREAPAQAPADAEPVRSVRRPRLKKKVA